MKISSSVESAPQVVTGQLGRDITKAGIYKRLPSTPGNHNDRLILLYSGNKLVYKPASAMKLQAAGDCSLCEQWMPVKEKFTITFDTTEE